MVDTGDAMAKVTQRGTRRSVATTRRTRLVETRAAGARGPDIATSPPTKARAIPSPATAAATIARLTKRLAEAKRLVARLKARADTDFLLDVANRRGFERELSRSIAYVKRYRATAALLIADVDGLKPINDTFGHAAGDHALKAIVNVLSRNVRQSDTVGRLGGDEFGLLLWNLAEGDALAKAAALEQAIDRTKCEYRGRRIALRVSIGVTTLGAEDAAADVLERADRSMYDRKLARRSRKKRVRR